MTDQNKQNRTPRQARDRKASTPNGYVPCTCRDCFEIAIGSAGAAFCHACEGAGCPDYQGQPGMSQECQVQWE